MLESQQTQQQQGLGSQSTMTCRTDDLHSADKALTKRLVQRAFAKVVSSEGKGLGEVRARTSDMHNACTLLSI